MSVLWEPIKEGFLKALQVILMLGKIVVPLIVIITFIQHTPLWEGLALVFRPILGVLNLPGEAAIPLTLGFFVNFYAAVGTISAMNLSAREITTLAVMLAICHELFMESAVCRYTGLRMLTSMGIRLSASILCALLLSLVYYIIG
ncbi:MAG: nucleoside recognition protein [Firmicutes bacterium]|nr:nucleoside recognition protein [Bacillota bacterium]